MKKLLLASVAVAAIAAAGSAGAADFPVYKAPPPIVPVWNWTGCYIGGHVGYQRSSYDQHLSFDDVSTPVGGAGAGPGPGTGGGGGAGTGPQTEFTFTDSLSPKGVIGGGQVGCNLQIGTCVWGVEGDFSSADRSDSRSYSPSLTSFDSVEFSAKTREMWSVRGRFGVAVDRAFVYATAGWAQARFSYAFALNDTDTGVSTGDTSFNTDGLVIGAGAEWAVWNNIVVGAEYLHYAFGNDKLLPSVPVIGPWGNAGDHINLKTVDVVRLRASYLFNWGGGGHY